MNGTRTPGSGSPRGKKCQGPHLGRYCPPGNLGMALPRPDVRHRLGEAAMARGYRFLARRESLLTGASAGGTRCGDRVRPALAYPRGNCHDARARLWRGLPAHDVRRPAGTRQLRGHRGDWTAARLRRSRGGKLAVDPYRALWWLPHNVISISSRTHPPSPRTTFTARGN